MAEALKCLKLALKILVKRSNALYDVLLATEEEEKTVSREYFDDEVSLFANEVHGRPPDNDYFSRGAYRYN